MKLYQSLLGIGLLVASAIAMGKKPPKTQTISSDGESDPAAPIPVTVNQDLILKNGSRGQEVSKLQALMNLEPDGIFGAITEAALFKLKSVRQTTIKQFLSSPTINQNILKVGSSIMAKNKLGAPIYGAVQKADTSYYSNYKIQKVIPYGQEIGVIRSANPAGNWYCVYYNDFPYTKLIGFVKSVDVENF